MNKNIVSLLSETNNVRVAEWSKAPATIITTTTEKLRKWKLVFERRHGFESRFWRNFFLPQMKPEILKVWMGVGSRTFGGICTIFRMVKTITQLCVSIRRWGTNVSATFVRITLSFKTQAPSFPFGLLKTIFFFKFLIRHKIGDFTIAFFLLFT